MPGGIMRTHRSAFTLALFAPMLLLGASAGVAATATASDPSNGTGYDPYADATLWTLTGDYAHFFSSSLGGFDYYGLTGTVKVPLSPDFALHFESGYHHVTFSGGPANDFAAGGSLVIERQDWHFGPAFGFQSSVGQTFTANTFNYGGFGQFYVNSSLAISAWGGGFHTDAFKWNGFYLTGDAEWYPTPDFSIDPEINFIDVPGGAFPFRETDYIAAFEWRPMPDRQFSIYGAYAYTPFSDHSHANTIYIALKFYNGAGEHGASAPLLLQRYEAIDVSPIVQGLVFKY
jgi:hypothetical protein